MELEVERNLRLIDHPLLIKMIGHVYPRGEPMPPFWRNGEEMTSYGYILIPYCEHGTLLDLLIKAK